MFNLIYRFVVGKASTPFYYIVVLIQLTLLAPILIKVIAEKWKVGKLLWFVTPVYLIYLYSFNIITGKQPKLYETIFPAWFLFYYLGLWIKMNGCNISRTLGKLQNVLVCLILSLIEACILMVKGCSVYFAISQIKISSFLYACFLILWLMEKREGVYEGKINQRLMIHIGDRSYGIFFIHCFVLLFTKKLCNIMFEDIWIFNFIICFLLTAAISVLMVDSVNIIARKLKIEKMLKWIGF